MKISIITVTFNCQNTISKTIESVISQTYKNLEYIVIDGNSNDNTKNIINKYKENITTFISENDNGIYDALNKGIKLAKGEFIVILHSGDIFYNKSTIEHSINEIGNYINTDIFFSNILFIENIENKRILRKYSSKYFKPFMFRFGFMPAHTSVIIRKKCFEDIGYYNIEYKIASDFDLLFNFIYINKIKYKYIDMYFTYMTMGGISTSGFKSMIKINNEIIHSLKSHNVYSNKVFIYFKYIFKIWSFILKKFYS